MCNCFLDVKIGIVVFLDYCILDCILKDVKIGIVVFLDYCILDCILKDVKIVVFGLWYLAVKIVKSFLDYCILDDEMEVNLGTDKSFLSIQKQLYYDFLLIANLTELIQQEWIPNL